MQRLARPFDGTLPVQVLLYEDESIVASQDNVGLYDGNNKSLEHQSGTVHVTTHRLIYVDSARPHHSSIAFSLASVSQTDYYAGFLTSSPKITVYFASSSLPDNNNNNNNNNNSTADRVESWICEVCDYKNPPELADASAVLKCNLCGVTRQMNSTKRKDRVYSGNIPPALSASTSAVSPPITSQDPVPCSACTFLNHPSLRTCEICGTPLASHLTRTLKSAPTSRPDTPTGSENLGRDFIKLSFRKAGDKHFYAALKRTLMGKAWEAKLRRIASNHGIESTTHAKSGIHGILQNVEQNAKAANDTLHEALSDLEALMVKARDMVELASSLNAKLIAQEEQRSRLRALHPELAAGMKDEPEEAKFIRSSLSQLGLQSTAITADMVKDEREWFEQLAKELGSVLINPNGGGLMRDRGILGLDEIWGGWNRARGVALIPPETMLMCLPHLPMMTDPPIRLRTFRSGLKVLHTPHYSTSSFTDRLMTQMDSLRPQNTMDIAMAEKITNSLALEMIEAVEEVGDVIRDEQGPGGETIWWKNCLRDYVWDGP